MQTIVVIINAAPHPPFFFSLPSPWHLHFNVLMCYTISQSNFFQAVFGWFMKQIICVSPSWVKINSDTKIVAYFSLLRWSHALHSDQNICLLRKESRYVEAKEDKKERIMQYKYRWLTWSVKNWTKPVSPCEARRRCSVHAYINAHTGEEVKFKMEITQK